MPVTVKYQKYQMSQYSRFDVGSPWGAGTISTLDQEVLFRNWPATVYRTKPADLFGNATARTTRNAFTQTSATTFVYNSGRDMHKGRPLAQMFPLGSVPTPAPFVSRPAMYNSVRNELRGKVSNLAMALAEYRQTASLFATAAKAVSSHGRSLAGAFTAKKGLSKAWLGFQYGVKPLTDDILTSIAELRAAAGQPVFVRGRKRRRDVRRLTDVYTFSYVSTQGWRCNREGIRSLDCVTLYRAKLNMNYVRNTLTAHGFTNPFSLAYELIPYSFVLDWWINVGDVLASLDNLLLIDYLEVVDLSSEVRGEYWTLPVQSPRINDYTTGGHASYNDRTDVRNAVSSISTINTIQYKPSASLTHILNGLALLHVARGRF